MGLLDKARPLANKGGQAGDKIVNAAEEAAKTVVNDAQEAAKVVVKEGRKGADAVADELKKARGIVSGDIDAFVRKSPAYAERLLTAAEKNLARKVFEDTLPYGAIYLSKRRGLGQTAYTT